MSSVNWILALVIVYTRSKTGSVQRKLRAEVWLSLYRARANCSIFVAVLSFTARFGSFPRGPLRKNGIPMRWSYPEDYETTGVGLPEPYTIEEPAESGWSNLRKRERSQLACLTTYISVSISGHSRLSESPHSWVPRVEPQIDSRR